jgi:putative exporter of polyketide antibiotics
VVFASGQAGLPEWVLELGHLASVPAVDINLRAALVVLLVSVVAATIGVMAFRRRDLQEP